MILKATQLFFGLLLFGSASMTTQSAVLIKNRMWPANSTLNVVFIDGNAAQKSLVKRIASLWTANSSLNLKFFDGFEQAPKQTQIRISFFSHNGSRLGDHGDYESKQPTLVLNKLNQAGLLDNEIKRLILHEFGHALGFEHEYRNPKWPFGQKPIDKHIQACIPQMQHIGYQPNEAASQCHEVNSTLSKDQVFATIYDASSIMNYPQQIELADGTIRQIISVSQLSVLDKLAVERWYGKKSH